MTSTETERPDLDIMADQITNAITFLGGMSEDQIADFFTSMGIKGKTCGATNCPVSVYIKSNYPDAKHVSTGPSMILVADNKDVIHESARRRLIFVPGSVRRFINLFDAGKWPEMVEGSSSV